MIFFSMEYMALVKCILLVLITCLQIPKNKCCIEEERLALLKIKATFQSDVLPSWVNLPKSDCCKWDRVTCNSTTTRVVRLSLNNTRQNMQSTWSSAPRTINGICFLNTSLFQHFEELKHLDLSFNHLGGRIRNQGFYGLERLEELDLSFNNFSGPIPLGLENLASLKMLDLSYAGFSGHIPSYLLASLSHLEYIDLGNNHFEGSFSFKLLANLSNLEVFLFKSSNKVKVLTEYPDWVPSFQLKVLLLSNCGINKIPEFLFHQFRLTILDLSHNKIQGKVPTWLLQNNTGLKYLSLKNNSFSGQITRELLSHEYVDLSYNKFSGSIPDWLWNSSNSVRKNKEEDSSVGTFYKHMGKILPFVSGLDLSSNNLSGKIPISIGNYPSQIQTLNLSHNQLTGSIPKSLLNLPKLVSLDFSSNQFSGEIPWQFMNLSELEVFTVAYNNLSGKIPDKKGQFMKFNTSSYEGNPFSSEPYP